MAYTDFGVLSEIKIAGNAFFICLIFSTLLLAFEIGPLNIHRRTDAHNKFYRGQIRECSCVRAHHSKLTRPEWGVCVV